MTDFRRKLEGCWLGKNIGGTLGAPFESFPVVNDITWYDPVPDEPLPNDDVELQLMYAAALDLQEAPEINRNTLAEIWRRHFSFHVDEYAVALRNLRLGILPPYSGVFDNDYTCGMGAAIRSELWACLAPGDPGLAAEFAREDACIDHAGDGIDAEVFLAALEAIAFTHSGSLKELVERALCYLPRHSALTQSIRETVSLYDECGDWLAVRNMLFDRYSSEFKTCVIPNVPFTVLALLHGDGDFGRTVCTAVNCGMDTDCSAATAGAVLGILDPDCIGERWIRPVGRGLVMRSSAVKDLKAPPDIDGLCDLLERCRRKIVHKVIPVENPEPDYSRFAREVEVAVWNNLHWYHIELSRLEWKTIRVNPIGGRLPVGSVTNGLQIVLRFRFEVPADGEYSVMFNSDSSNQCYLDPPEAFVHDSMHMTFGRQRLWLDVPDRDGCYRVSARPVIYSPTLSGAPLNQIKRHIPLKKGAHVLYAAVEPLPWEQEIRWGFGVGLTADSAFL